MALKRNAGRAAALLALVALAVATPAARAGLLPGSCPNVVLEHPFVASGDYATYELAPGGSFEGNPGWSLAGGAKVVSGNEPFYVHSKTDNHSLSLPSGSSATSPSMCAALLQPNLKMVARNTGSQSATLRVQVVVRGLLGLLSVLDGGTISAGSTWSPTAKLLMVGSSLTGPVTGSIQFRLTPIGSGSGWQVDDLYVDPFLSK